MSSSIQLTRAQFICFALATASAAVMLTISIITIPLANRAGNTLTPILIVLSIIILGSALAAPFQKITRPITPTMRFAPVIALAFGLVLTVPPVIASLAITAERWREGLHNLVFVFSSASILLQVAGHTTFVPRKDDSVAPNGATQP